MSALVVPVPISIIISQHMHLQRPGVCLLSHLPGKVVHGMPACKECEWLSQNIMLGTIPRNQWPDLRQFGRRRKSRKFRSLVLCCCGNKINSSIAGFHCWTGLLPQGHVWKGQGIFLWRAWQRVHMPMKAVGKASGTGTVGQSPQTQSLRENDECGRAPSLLVGSTSQVFYPRPLREDPCFWPPLHCSGLIAILHGHSR